MSKSNFNRYFQLFLIVIAAGAIYPVIYLRQNYQETILAVFNMSMDQLNIIYSVLGIVFVAGYFPSGLLSDKFSAKKLLVISLLGTAVGGFWFAQVPNYTNVILIFCIWGTFSVFTFWSAHMKLVKLIAKQEEEGRFFGILDGGRGVIEAVLASVAIFIFSRMLGASTLLVDKKAALVTIIYMYSIILVIAAVLVFIFVEDDKKSPKQESLQPDTAKMNLNFKDMAEVFKNKLVLLLGFIIFASYAVTWVTYYFSGFLETNVLVSSVTAGQVMVVVLWMRPIGGIVGGFIADKVGKTNTMIGAITGAGTCLIIMSALPVSAAKPIFYILVVLAGVFVYAIRGTYWSLLGDCRIQDKVLGATIGFVSLIGYLPDIILPLINSQLFKVFGPNGGYNAYFITSAIVGAIGVCLLVVFRSLSKKNEKGVPYAETNNLSG
ncbi:MFS transporter [Paenibacillus selenitireducens]|uniref:MFS transporter n=1 Tax=Paenibacillus selenitireducens TaxID=1324314 RepID=A0A1T2X4J9_9BACL|nr:MFS transporter [Paenibacillus selenitireducens]OPA74780.1 MFS transporter [Paenibacillus selenitireducens]